jgi:hypothetical protein
MGISLVYDWMYDYLSPSFRVAMRDRVIAELKAVQHLYGVSSTSIDYYTGNHGFIDNAAYGIAGLL